MATVYILYSQNAKRFYIGSCLDLKLRLNQHSKGEFKLSYTSNHSDWELYYEIGGLEYSQSRKIENHIKKMRSRKYIENLKVYPEIMAKLKLKYSD